jgi:SAM-dependent methyltransferase
LHFQERSFLSGLKGVQFLRANFNEDHFPKPITDKSLDVVVSTEVIEHIYHHPLGYLRECLRVLGPGGLLLLSTPNPCTLANAARLVVGKEISWGSLKFAETPELGPESVPVAVWDIHFREYTQYILREIVGKLEGSEIIEQGFLASGRVRANRCGSDLRHRWCGRADCVVGDHCVRRSI